MGAAGRGRFTGLWPLVLGLVVGGAGALLLASALGFDGLARPGLGPQGRPETTSSPPGGARIDATVEDVGSRAGHDDAFQVPPHVRWIAAGGGSEPSSNQVSLEQDLALARRAFGADGVLLHAGGEGVGGVQVRAGRRSQADPGPEDDPLVLRIGEVVDPRDDRDTRYRPGELPGAGAATLELLDRALVAALGEPRGGPLLLYLAGHGEQGETRRDNLVRLWGGWGLTVGDLAATLDAAPARRRVRVVVAACFAGGFAELVFAGARPERGGATTDRCGFFATTWDRESSGCDPNPLRSAQEGYSLHLLHALRGEDRQGAPLPLATVDLDGDGAISLLEAHTRARIASRSIDVPTTTSEAWLREVEAGDAPVRGGREASIPEEDAVVDALGRELGVADGAAARRRLDEVQRELRDGEERLAPLEDEADDRWAALRIGLLERWPLLEDPFHPGFFRTVTANHDSIERYITRSAQARRWARTRAALERADAASRRVALELQRTRLTRLLRARETRRLAARLRARGGSDWTRYQRLLTCERGAVF